MSAHVLVGADLRSARGDRWPVQALGQSVELLALAREGLGAVVSRPFTESVALAGVIEAGVQPAQNDVDLRRQAIPAWRDNGIDRLTHAGAVTEPVAEPTQIDVWRSEALSGSRPPIAVPTVDYTASPRSRRIASTRSP